MPTTQTSGHRERNRWRLLNRELSWLDLMTRVLELAADRGEPLLERVRFCGIFSSNLDEFFMVRVAGLLDQVASGLGVRSPDGRTPQQTLDRGARARARADGAPVASCGATSSARRSPREGILVGTVDDATEEELRRARGDVRAARSTRC